MNYGISNLSIVPMRNEAADQSEMVNQVIFGEHFKVLEIRKKWSKIRLAHDSYEGWICNKQWIEIEEDIYKQLDKEVATITTDILDIITKTHHQPIVIGSILPSYKSGHALINNEMYQFDGLTTPGFIKKDKLVENALMYLNAPYLWGGKTPMGIDCSGLTQMTYRINGYNIPRDASQQSLLGETFSFIDESEPGDLAFFDDDDGNITHVGLLLENHHILHAHGNVRIDRVDQTGIYNIKTQQHSHKLRIMKKII